MDAIIAAILDEGRWLAFSLIASTDLVNAGLLAGAIVFWMSGQIFEQFSGMTPER
jgi:hypothetical protein